MSGVDNNIVFQIKENIKAMDYMHAIADASQPRKTKHLITNLARKF
jgi:hypothetical protein